MKFEDLLNCKEYLHLSSISDAGDNKLRAEICIGGHKLLPREVVGKHVNEISKMPLEYTDAQYCELIWKWYFSFMVSDEGIAPVRKEQKYIGHAVRVFEKSWLLNAVPELSNGAHEVRGTVKHYGVYCLNHIVDVLAYEEPIVNDLGLRSKAPEMPWLSRA